MRGMPAPEVVAASSRAGSIERKAASMIRKGKVMLSAAKTHTMAGME